MDDNLEKLSDEELMLCFQKGDDAGFRVLVDRYRQRIFAFTWRFLNGSQEAEDIAQEVFVKVYFARESWRQAAKFSTWVYVITRNTCLQALKKMGSRLSVDSRQTEDGRELIETLVDGNAKTPSDHALAEEKSRRIADALDRLPESQKMAIILRRYDQLSYEEIAEVMNCSVQSVKSLLFRGHTSLREHLKEYFADGA